MPDLSPANSSSENSQDSSEFSLSGALPGQSQTRVYAAQFDNLEPVRQFVGEAARQSGLDDSAIYAAQLAVDEAFTNIIEHAYGGESLEKIECSCEIFEAGLVITLCDCGKPFDPVAVPDPDLEADLEDRDIGGLGLYFIRQLMDEVEFNFTRQAETGKLCNVLRMVKRKES